eukprot:TRINITY_DN61582_c0_g1_i1.p1 TRINITY_DN61582_c0_g1~~TRINITY_DN61582_c0_g1_i1.p1  ORF type:complete len:648 (-),score=60.15 TRINITY_DN61582_c0_g1_i1:99-2042(-)
MPDVFRVYVGAILFSRACSNRFQMLEPDIGNFSVSLPPTPVGPLPTAVPTADVRIALATVVMLGIICLSIAFCSAHESKTHQEDATSQPAGATALQYPESSLVQASSLPQVLVPSLKGVLPRPPSSDPSSDPTAQTIESRAAENEPVKRPGFVLVSCCVGARFLYQASFTVLIPQSYALTREILLDQGSTSNAWAHALSGSLIAIQQLSYVIVICLARYGLDFFSDFSLILGFLLASMAGSLLLCWGLLAPISAWTCAAVLLSGRVVQGLGAGVEYTTKQILTRHCSADIISSYFAYLSGGSSFGGGFGTILVFAATVVPGFAGLPLKHQTAMPMVFLVSCQLVQVLVITLLFPRSGPDKPASLSKKCSIHVTVPMTYTARKAVIFTTVFFEFSRHMLRSAWEATSVLVMVDVFGVQLQDTSLFVAAVLCFSYPAMATFAVSKGLLSDTTWLHGTCVVAAYASIMMIDIDEDSHLTRHTQMYFYMCGSLLLYCMLSINGCASDALGVIYADNDDPLLNSSNVVFWQGMAKGCLGRLAGPVVGSMTVLRSQWTFPMLMLSVLSLMEVMTLLFIPSTTRPVPSRRSFRGAASGALSDRCDADGDHMVARQQERLNVATMACAVVDEPGSSEKEGLRTSCEWSKVEGKAK